MKNRFLITTLFALTALSSLANAQQTPHIFGSNMVLQRDKPVPVWGKANAGEKVTVTFAGQSKSAVTDKGGHWRVTLDAMPANAKPQDMVIAGKDRVVFQNILVGEVWICSGQSNMEWTLNGSMNPKTEAAAAKFPLIRHIKVPHQDRDAPQYDFNGSWSVCSPRTVGGYTAVGYFFARKLYRELGIPIGLVNTSWGGTRIEPWTPLTGFKKIENAGFTKSIIQRIEEADPTTTVGKKRYASVMDEFRNWVVQSEKRIASGQYPKQSPQVPSLGNGPQQPARLYRGMIHPLVPFAMRGAIWYQGESNGSEGRTYYQKMQGLIRGWRHVWGQGDFPFYFVQLANYTQDRNTPEGADGYAKVRDAQRQSLEIPNTGMAVIIDIGETRDIHPKNKQDVGTRLAHWALAKDYKKDVVASGPLYKSHKVQGQNIHITFDYADGGLMVGKKEGLAPTAMAANTPLARFAIAGKDRKWHWADAKIDGDAVVVSSSAVTNPVAVRYAFSANPLGANLYNKAGLPASPFRTDNW
jgi:sialate O-acetylesterase